MRANEAWWALHPADRRREIRRLDLAFGAHAFLGTILALAFLGHAIPTDTWLYTAILYLLGPWTFFLLWPTALVAAILSLRRPPRPRRALGRDPALTALGLALVAVPAVLLAAENSAGTTRFLAVPFFAFLAVAGPAAGARWLTVDRRRLVDPT